MSSKGSLKDKNLSGYLSSIKAILQDLRKHTILFVVLFALIQISVTALLYIQTQKAKDEQLSDLLKELQYKVQSVETSLRLMTNALFSDYINRDELIAPLALAAGNPSRIKAANKEIARIMKDHFRDLNSIKKFQMQFHLPDGTSLIRLHAPLHFGDNLMELRPAVKKVHNEKIKVESFEVGRFFVGYRYFFPVKKDGTYIGAIEMGIAYKEINEELAKVIKGDYLLLIRKHELEKLSLEIQRNDYVKSIFDDELYLHIGDQDRVFSNDKKGITYKRFVENVRDEISSGLYADSPFIVYDSVDREYYAAGFIPIRDVNNTTTAYISFFIKDNVLYSFQKFFYIKTLLLTIAIFSITAYIVVLKRSQKYLSEKNDLIRDSMRTIRAHNLFLKTIIDSIPYPFYVVDITDYKVLLMNSAASSLVEPSNKDCITCYGLSHKIDRPCSEDAHQCPMKLMIQTGMPQLVEHIHYSKTGDPIFVEVHAIPVYDGSGRLVHMIEYALDITERKQTERYLREAKENAEEASYLKSKFLSNVSHEIRTPLNGIIGMLTLLATSELKEAQQEHLEIATKSAHMLLSIINDILDFSKIERGRLEIEATVFAARDLIEETCSVFSFETQKKGLLYERHIDDLLPELLIGDPLRLKQILFNLLGNAFKFTTKGKISLKVHMEDIQDETALVLISVSDTGIGIPADKKDAIFESFHQVDSSTSRRYGGTGLGLAITKELVHLMGGEIWFSSEPGFGSTFFCRLPFKIPNNDTEDIPPSALAEDPSAYPMRIMVVEDNPINQKIIHGLLTKKGHLVSIAGSEDEALKLFSEREFDLILMDIELPDHDGFEVTRKIKTLNSNIPVVALTAHVSEYHRIKCLETGMAGYLTKPVNYKELVALLSKISKGRKGG